MAARDRPAHDVSCLACLAPGCSEPVLSLPPNLRTPIPHYAARHRSAMASSSPVWLRRDHREVVLHDPFRPPFAMVFHTATEAAAYLRFWVAEPGGMERLRLYLTHWMGMSVQPMTDDEVIEALATRIVRGELALSSWVSGADLPELLHPPEKQALAAGLPAPPKLPATPLLPRLELVQIAGAGVLVEIKQTLDQVKAALAEVGGASVSIQPAPTGVPPVQSSLTKAGANISSTLGSL